MFWSKISIEAEDIPCTVNSSSKRLISILHRIFSYYLEFGLIEFTLNIFLIGINKRVRWRVQCWEGRNFKNLVCKRLFLTLSKRLLFFQYSYKITNKKFGFWENVVFAINVPSRGTFFFVTLFGASLIVRLTLELIVLTNESSWSRYE